MDFKIFFNDFPVLCRFCLLQSDKLKLISEVPSTKIFTTLTEIQFNDKLPENICSSCEEIFQTFSIFIENSIQNNVLLNSVLNDSAAQKDCDILNLKYDYFSDQSDIDSHNDNDMLKNKIKDDEDYIPEENKRVRKKRILPHKKVKKRSAEYNKKCETCMKEFQTQKLLSSHFKISPKCMPEKLKFSCKKCGKLFVGKGQLNSHYKEFEECAPETIKLTCENCKTSFVAKMKLYAHYKESPGCIPKEFSCLLCNKAFSKKYRLENHMRSHTKEEPFECRECGKKFRFRQNLRRHYLIHEGVKPFKCEVCNKAFSRAHVKNEHMNIHTGNNPYICMYCGKGFKRYANHFIHVYRHKLINGEVDKSEDKKLYLQLECNVCNKIFASRGGLANHLTLHQDEPREKKFLCNECGKGFVTKAQLESHSRIHTGDRPYECSHCGKRFRQKSAFSNHKLVHSGEKPYKCKICEKLFTQSGHLKAHMRIHSGEKPFCCSFCGKTFALKSNLKVHTRIHTGETPYVCSVCGHGYYDSSSLKKHTKTHGIGVPSHGYVGSIKDQDESGVAAVQ